MHDLTIILHIENAGDLYTFTYWASVRYERVVQCSDSIIHDTFSIVFNEQGGGGGGGGGGSVRVQHEITGQIRVPQFVCNCGKW